MRNADHSLNHVFIFQLFFLNHHQLIYNLYLHCHSIEYNLVKMKVGILLLGLSVGTLAVQQPLKQYMVSYTEDTPPSVLEEAKHSILAAVCISDGRQGYTTDKMFQGGKIVHEFGLYLIERYEFFLLKLAQIFLLDSSPTLPVTLWPKSTHYLQTIGRQSRKILWYAHSRFRMDGAVFSNTNDE